MIQTSDLIVVGSRRTLVEHTFEDIILNLLHLESHNSHPAEGLHGY